MERRLSTTLTSTANLCIPTAHLLPWWPGLDDDHKTNVYRSSPRHAVSERTWAGPVPVRPARSVHRDRGVIRHMLRCPSSLRMRHVDQGVRLDGGPACDHSQK